jgi:hypothetical protein
MGAGCHTLCLFPLHEAQREPQRAVIGMMDITIRPQVDPDILSFSMPYRMFQEMEANVAGSFLETHAWHKVRERIPEPARMGPGARDGSDLGRPTVRVEKWGLTYVY